MANPTAASSFAALMANLQQSRSTSGDFTISCEGHLIKAHSVILAHGSDYFKSAMAFDKTAIDIKECLPALLTTAVDFLYGVEVPAEVEDLRGLLSLADSLLMESLREVAGRRLGEQVTAANCIEMSQLAETYRSTSLATACAKIIVSQGEEGVGWRAIEELPSVMAAVAKVATKGLWNAKKSTVKELKDFPTQKGSYSSYVWALKSLKDFPTQRGSYSSYVKANTKEGTRVQCTESFAEVDERELGTVTENTGRGLRVAWDKESLTTNTSYAKVKLVYSPENDLPLAN